ncbi:PhzF family phenazine biosynthesis isomerase [Pseudomonas sp. FSL R10-0056]|uniref:PhzF family phenazine biosynthesis protein n=1 Tax=Pseudomonas TaxID=286 RepID=UPI000BA20F42|nr:MULTISPECIES: PhzF family phenazine biosynthesis protein [Pseudomonas]MQT63886.1 PhzF family phenazine biosynthesis isomerase [Pseudomonas sp. FSL R10-0056]MQT69257.1 PhzF family phenazine biosynthesis isomerase [Pseudomonas sp. FSL R10-0071]MQU48013.1 PhzF family phenazine biosynthesis isomerase [Pseudomonas sp. FSL A6-1183]OZY62089.1 phenazine biosynthesis protein PhzF [Pseudomonas fragi]PAA18392.1 phenazine biosynthesis protein PhzF [Pseudomonas fragi]
MRPFEFKQVDVFSSVALKGNPVAVVLNADSLSDMQMADFARWTNLSETTFVLKPQNPDADYRLRIFTTLNELPFAGHPTLGSCHAWLEAGGVPRGQEIVQECAAGLIRLRRQAGQLAFTAPPLLRTGAVEGDLLQRICRGLGIEAQAVVQARWVDNGPGWVALMLRDREQVLALEPDYSQLLGLSIGVVAPWQPELDGDEAQFEVRAFCAGEGMPEDPVTGSLNAGLAQWLIGAGLAPAHYVASQGTAMGRAGRVSIEQIGEDIWVGGPAVTCISGQLTL